MGTRLAGEVVRRRYTVTGVVQGVGFRPFVHRVAAELALSGFVGNAAGEVFVEVQGDADAVAVFADRLVAQAPPLARIAAVVDEARSGEAGSGFAIVPSRGGGGGTPRWRGSPRWSTRRFRWKPGPGSRSCPAAAGRASPPSPRTSRCAPTACASCSPPPTAGTATRSSRARTAVRGSRSSPG